MNNLETDRYIENDIRTLNEAIELMKNGGKPKPQKAVYQERSHGKTWYKCPHCDLSFEFFTAMLQRNGFKIIGGACEIGCRGDFDEYRHYYIECPGCHQIFDLG